MKKEKYSKKHHVQESELCDLVYLWVDGNCPEMIEKRKFWLKKYNKPVDKQSTNKCRFIDNEELKYSLRSVEKYAPWINNIFIVTDNQVPKWLNTSHPKIHMVDHTEIMPQEALPTFNSSAIETCIHKIKGLSEFFIFANDDMFFARPTDFHFFFNENNLPILRLGSELPPPRNSMYYSHLLYSYNLINEKFGTHFCEDPDHNITPYRKSIIEECIENFKNEFDYVKNCKFRKYNTVQRTIYSVYGYAAGKTVIKKINPHRSLLQKIILLITKKAKKDSIYFPTGYKKIIHEIKKYKPHLICINDNEKTTNENRKDFKIVIEKLFPNKSEFEL